MDSQSLPMSPQPPSSAVGSGFSRASSAGPLASQVDDVHHLDDPHHPHHSLFDDPAVTPESMGDADSGVEIKSVDIKSESDHFQMDVDSGDEVPPAEPAPNAKVYDVRCGSLTGKLYEERFTCPGIHKKCIEYEGRLISPREFTIRAEKDKQKDWKGSIRVDRYNLRTLMEMKKIDFYEHETNCSLKCQSRNYIKNRKQAAMESLSFLDNLVKSGAATINAVNDLAADQPSSSNSPLFKLDFGLNGSTDFNASLPNNENGGRTSGNRKGSSALDEYVSRMTSAALPSAFKASSETPEKQHPSSGGAFHAAKSTPKHEPAAPTQHQTPMTPQSMNAVAPQPTPTTPQFGGATGGLPTDFNLANLQMAFKAFGQQMPPLGGVFPNQFANSGSPNENEMAMLLCNLMAANNPKAPEAPIIPPATPTSANQSVFGSSNGFNCSGAGGITMSMLDGDAVTGGAIRRILEQQPAMFWEKMRDMNLVDDLASNIVNSVERMKGLYRNADPRTDALIANKLSSMALSLELTDEFARKIQATYVQTSLQKEVERKAAAEQKRRQQQQQQQIEAARIAKNDLTVEQLIKVSQSMDPTQLHLIQQLLMQHQATAAAGPGDMKQIRLNI